jgi:DNA-binding transcriptional MerR regulator
MSADLSSGDLARATGNTVRAIRFYEEERLLVPAVVSDGGHRRYTEDDLERLRLITDLRELGLSICEIRSVLEIRTGCSTASEFALRFQQVLAGHLEQAQRRLERLGRVKKELLEALTTMGQSLSARGGEQCPCTVADDGRAPRIVRVLARQAGCCAHGSHDGEPDEARRG